MADIRRCVYDARMNLSEWIKRRLWAFSVGTFVTTLAVLAYLAGWIVPLSRY